MMAASHIDFIHSLKRAGQLADPHIADAFFAIDRGLFMSDDHKEMAYRDVSSPITTRETISQPSTVAFMFHLLAPRPRMRILDIGSGSGFTTALLAHIAGAEGSVLGLERNPALVVFGRANLGKYRFANARIEQARAELGAHDQGPFDRILVSAAAERFPESLLSQLAGEGRLVLPIQSSLWLIQKRHDGAITRSEFPGFRFIPLQ